MIVIADTTPLNYLVLINQVGVLPQLYGRVLIPVAVWEEFQRPQTPPVVRAWIAQPPPWLQVRPVEKPSDPAIENLGAGECEAIALAAELHADRLIMDDRAGRRFATERNLVVIGTLGVLAEAAEHGLLDFSDTIARLQQTSFYVSPEVLNPLLQRYAKNR
jgi:predicted nucleic acid-binding protein